MRTPSLQYLYLQKPVTMIVVLCILSILPWIGTEGLSSHIESGETTVIASAILESGEWVLPKDASNNFISNPPMMPWLVTLCSLPQGYVSDFTSRLPSALALILLISFTLVFFGERIKFQEAFIGSLLLLTCMGVHRSGMLSDTDMLFSAFMVLALYGLYRWENKLELKGLPISIPILLGGAVLTKGLVGIMLPLFTYGIYLFVLQKHRLGVMLKALLYIGVSSMFLPLMWYVSAWRESGEGLLTVIMSGDYHTGVKEGLWYNAITLISGFMPWTIFFFFSLFGIKTASLKKTGEHLWSDIKQGIRSMEKMKLFSLIVLICVFFFFSFLPVKRLTYLLPAYPFIAVFLAQYSIYLTEYRTKVTRVFAVLSLLVTIPFLVITGLSMANVIELPFLSSYLTLTDFSLLHGIIMLMVIFFITVLIYQLFKKTNIKILYATIALTFSTNLLVDSIIK